MCGNCVKEADDEKTKAQIATLVLVWTSTILFILFFSSLRLRDFLCTWPGASATQSRQKEKESTEERHQRAPNEKTTTEGMRRQRR